MTSGKGERTGDSEVYGMLQRALVLSFLTLVAVSRSAHADAIFALQWRDTGTQQLTILPGDTAAGGRRTLDLVLTIDVPWCGFGATVALPDGSPLTFTGAEGWGGVSVPGVGWTSFDRPARLEVDDPFWHLEAYQEAFNLVTVMVPPFGPPFAPPGSYIVGSVQLDTSAAEGASTIESLFVRTLDGLLVDDGTGSQVYSDDATFLHATLGAAQLVVVPEPAPAGLTGLGLALFSLHRSRVSRRHG